MTALPERRRIVLDCDPGLDDALAILCAHRYAELVAITTVNGNVGIDNTTHNALAVTQLAGIDVPVHRGAAQPIARPARDRHAAHVHGTTGLGDVELPTLSRAVTSDDAIGFLLDTAADDIDLVAVGPLTNLAHALARDGSFIGRWRSLTIMGGALDLGNATTSAEFNIWADPEAAAAVLGAATDRPRTLVPLNLTHLVRADAAMVDELEAAGSVPARLAAQLLRYATRRRGDLGPPALHDPCAVLAVTHPQHFSGRDEAIVVDLTAEHLGRTARSEGPPNTTIAHDVERDLVVRLITNACIDPCAPGER